MEAAPRRSPPKGFYTALRAIACLVLILAFSWNIRLVTVGAIGVLAIATLAAILVAYELSIRDVQIEWISAITAGILCLAGSGYLVWHLIRPAEPTGPLLAANEQTPPRTSCSIALGPNDKVLIATETPHMEEMTAFGLSAVHGCPNLQLVRVGRGLSVNATFYDRGNDIAFRLIENVYAADTDDLRLTQYRPDPSTLEIFDHLGRRAFYLRYLNSKAVLIRAPFFAR